MNRWERRNSENICGTHLWAWWAIPITATMPTSMAPTISCPLAFSHKPNLDSKEPVLDPGFNSVS